MNKKLFLFLFGIMFILSLNLINAEICNSTNFTIGEYQIEKNDSNIVCVVNSSYGDTCQGANYIVGRTEIYQPFYLTISGSKNADFNLTQVKLWGYFPSNPAVCSSKIDILDNGGNVLLSGYSQINNLYSFYPTPFYFGNSGMDSIILHQGTALPYYIDFHVNSCWANLFSGNIMGYGGHGWDINLNPYNNTFPPIYFELWGYYQGDNNLTCLCNGHECNSCSNGICDYWEDSQTCPSDCNTGSYDMNLSSEIVDSNGNGLYPDIYNGLWTFFSYVYIPIAIIFFVILFILIFLLLINTGKKFVNKIQ